MARETYFRCSSNLSPPAETGRTTYHKRRSLQKQARGLARYPLSFGTIDPGRPVFYPHSPARDGPSYPIARRQDLSGRNGTETRRSSRVTLRVPLQIYESGTDTRSLLEESHSVKVSLWGGLLALKSAVKQGQGLVVRNQSTGETKEAYVVYLKAMHLGRRLVAIEFLEPSPEFWGLAFPPPAAPSRYRAPAESFHRG